MFKVFAIESNNKTLLRVVTGSDHYAFDEAKQFMLKEQPHRVTELVFNDKTWFTFYK